VFAGMIFPIIINTYTGFKNVPRVYVEAAKVLGCTRNIDSSAILRSLQLCLRLLQG
jgi:ABC-type nitrate/sulfonate/bicarbonate transport system permease component